MTLGLRQKDILALAETEGRVAVDDLARRFDVTEQTIRRDLADLVDGGYLDRVHGGAVLRAGVANIGYDARRRMHAGAKAAIGRACAAMVPDTASLILNLGTTTEAVARALMGHRNLTVITNNMNVANTLAANPSCEVMVAGGALRRSDGGLVGDLTTQFFEQFKVDYAIIGASALDPDGDLLDFDLAEVRVSQTIIARARRVLVVCDASKLSRSAPVRIASLSQTQGLVTDAPLHADLAKRCAEWGCEVIVAAV